MASRPSTAAPTASRGRLGARVDEAVRVVVVTGSSLALRPPTRDQGDDDGSDDDHGDGDPGNEQS